MNSQLDAPFTQSSTTLQRGRASEWSFSRALRFSSSAQLTANVPVMVLPSSISKQGVRFGSSLRRPFPPQCTADTPSPCDYYTDVRKFKGFSFTTSVSQEKREEAPVLRHYEFSRGFASRCRGVSFKAKGKFGILNWVREGNPAPDSYHQNFSCVQPTKNSSLKFTKEKRVYFDIKEDGSPGPGQYEIKSKFDRLATLKIRHKYLNDVKKTFTYPFTMKCLFWSTHPGSGTQYPKAREGHTFLYTPWNKQWAVFGGVGLQRFNDVYSLNTSLGSWNQVHPQGELPMPRNNHVSWVDPASQVLFIFGGQGLKREFLYDMQCLNFRRNRWVKLYPVEQPTGRVSAAGCVLGSKFYLFAGASAPNDMLNNDLWSFEFARID